MFIMQPAIAHSASNRVIFARQRGAGAFSSVFQEHRIFVQRLFSTFANGWPGRGLLIQRVLVGGALLYRDFACLSTTPVPGLAIHDSIGALGGILLMAGLWTPVAGVLVACIEAWIALSAPPTAGIPVALAVLGLTLAMIGPGTWSVDARLYGRKRIALPEP